MPTNEPSTAARILSPIDLFVALVTLAAPFFLFSIASHFRDDPLFKQLWNLGHVGAFFVWTWYLTYRWTRLAAMPLGLRLLALVGLNLGAGLAIEAIQFGTGRSADGWDIARNLLGSFLALCWTTPHARTMGAILLKGCRVFSILLLLLAVTPFLLAMADKVYAQHQFPRVADFESPFELERWSGEARFERSSERSLSGRYALKVNLSTKRYSGVQLQIYPRDWRRYHTLEIGIYNPEPTAISMTCRIHDFRHTQGPQFYEDRFNRSYVLDSGWNNIEITLREVQRAPAGRFMEMSDIMALGLFAVRLDRPRVVYLDRIRLRDSDQDPSIPDR